MKDFSLILPTRDRPLLLERLFDSILQTTADPQNLEIIAYLDSDDPLKNQISHPVLDLRVITGPRQTMGKISNLCAVASQGGYLALINDDVVFRTPEWDRKIKAAFSRFPDGIGLVYPNDLYYRKKMATFPILSREVYQKMGQICPEEYQSHCIDAHLFDVFTRLEKKRHRRLIYLPEVVFEHMHYGLGMEVYEGQARLCNDAEDQARFVHLANEREELAENLAEFIESASRSLNGQVLKKEEDKKEKRKISLYLRVGHQKPQELEKALSRLAVYAAREDLDLQILVSKTAADIILPKLLKEKVKWMEAGVPLSSILHQAHGDYLIFLDAKAQPEAHWFEALLQAATEDEVGIVGSLWVHPRHGRVDQCGLAFVQNRHGLKPTFLYQGLELQDPAINKPRNLQAVPMIGALIKRGIFEANAELPSSNEAEAFLDLCLKVRKLSKKIICSPEAILYYGEASPESCSISLEREEKLESDLKKILLEDGFRLEQSERKFLVYPNRENDRESSKSVFPLNESFLPSA